MRRRKKIHTCQWGSRRRISSPILQRPRTREKKRNIGLETHCSSPIPRRRHPSRRGQHGSTPDGDGSAGTSSSRRIRFLNINVSIGGKSVKQKNILPETRKWSYIPNALRLMAVWYLFLQLNWTLSSPWLRSSFMLIASIMVHKREKHKIFFETNF